MSLEQDRRSAAAEAQVTAITRSITVVLVVGASLSAVGLGWVFWATRLAEQRTGPGLSVAVEVPGGALTWAVAFWTCGALLLIFALACQGQRRACQTIAATANAVALVLYWVLAGAGLSAVLDGAPMSLVLVPMGVGLGAVHLALTLLYGVSAILDTDDGRRLLPRRPRQQPQPRAQDAPGA